jgi:hypothetical protein
LAPRKRAPSPPGGTLFSKTSGGTTTVRASTRGCLSCSNLR